MLKRTQTPQPTVTVDPTTEPLTISEAKRHLSLATSDTAHDVKISSLIASAREQFERDTGTYYIKRTVSVTLSSFCEYQFTHQPINSISSISYYDSLDASQTLATSVYQLDAPRRQLRLKYNQTWPTVNDRFDAVTITYILGSHDDSTTVPSSAKSAMLLLVGNEFEQRDMMTPDYTQTQRAYERMVARFMRASYP